jgi:hypothetical protein
MSGGQKTGAAKRGRSSKYTPALARRIIVGLSKGAPLTIICGPSNMPSDDTVNWAEKDSSFSRDIARAREAGFGRIALDALTIADAPMEGIEWADIPEGPRIKWGDMLGHRRLQVEMRLKLLSKCDPKLCGERITQEIIGPDADGLGTAMIVAMAEMDFHQRSRIRLSFLVGVSQAFASHLFRFVAVLWDEVPGFELLWGKSSGGSVRSSPSTTILTDCEMSFPRISDSAH